MTRTPRKAPPPFPTKEEILAFVRGSDDKVGKREIARAFNITGTQRSELKRLLRELQDEGQIEKRKGKRFAQPGDLPAVTVVEVTGIDTDGDVLARPVTWRSDDAPPRIYMAPEKRGQAALGRGERVLARLTRIKADLYEGRTIRRIHAAPSLVLGIFRKVDGECRLQPTDRRARADFLIAPGDEGGAADGDLVRAQVLPGGRLGLRHARIMERLDGMDSPRAISLIAIHDHDIPTEFSHESLSQAKAAKAAPLGERTDLRDLPLVTIDGADARDFDDAVFAEPDGDGKNPGGWHVLVAIADVAWYVRPGSALDKDAYARGNSVYFPDRVVPMLPEELSNGWCSLNPREDRPCMAVHMWIDAAGNLLRHKFVRGMMRSVARLTYSQVQEARDGNPDDTTAPLMETVIGPLYGAYESFLKAREKRGVLDLDLPERRVMLDAAGNVTHVETRERFDSHKLIEEFMIAANVAAAQALEKAALPCMYRVHDRPSPEKLAALRDFLDSIDVHLPRGPALKPAAFNAILKRAQDTPQDLLVNQVILRSQAQAEYDPVNIGHFGLALARYCHFTSPIRRYSDLLVHRALIRAGRFGEGGLEPDHRDFAQMGEHISATERRAATAERDAVDRFTAAYLAERVGATFAGRVNGVTRFGLFVTLDESGGDGLVPISTLPDDYYVHDEARHELRGRATGRTYRLGESVEVRLVEAQPVTGGLILELLDDTPARPRKGGKGARKVKSTKKGKAGKTGKPRPPSRGKRRR